MISTAPPEKRFFPMTPEDFTVQWTRFQERWLERDERLELIDRVVRGDWEEVGPDGEGVENRSPNLIQVALEDTAEAASLIPSVRVLPSKRSTKAKEDADLMEKLGISYMKASEFELLTIRVLLDLIGRGLLSIIVTHDPELGPRLEWRDPRTCFPEPDPSSLGTTRKAFFARDLYVTQLSAEWQAKIKQHAIVNQEDYERFVDHAVTLVEYYDHERTTIGVVYTSTHPTLNSPYRQGTAISIILEDEPNLIGMCPVISTQRMTFDGEPRGQFDQVVPVMLAHIRLMALVLDYADQAVYSDVWVKDLIGHMPIGGGSYIQLGPQGQIGRVPPAVSSLQVYEQLQQLIENVHLGGRWPKTRPGDIDQNIASGKFVEATAGVLNTVIRTYHLLLAQTWRRALRVCFAMDKKLGKNRVVSGVLRNQQFRLERDVSDIDLSAEVNVVYGLGLGRDPAQSMVLAIQSQTAGFISREFVQENMEGLDDVALERRRILEEQFKDMALAKLQIGLQDGTIPGSALVQIAQATRKGDDIFELYQKYVVKPEEEMQAQMLTSGLTGESVMPGAPQALGPAPPTPPPPEDLLAGLLGGGGGQAPPETINRLSTPAGPPGSFAGTQTTGGGG